MMIAPNQIFFLVILLSFSLVTLIWLSNMTLWTLAYIVIMTALVSVWLYREWLRKAPGSKHWTPLSPAYLKVQLEVQNTLAQFYLIDGKELKIWPYLFSPYQVVIPKTWWEEAPNYYKRVFFVYLTEHLQHMNETPWKKLFFVLRSLLGLPINYKHLKAWNQPAQQILKQRHLLEPIWLKLLFKRYPEL